MAAFFVYGGYSCIYIIIVYFLFVTKCFAETIILSVNTYVQTIIINSYDGSIFIVKGDMNFIFIFLYLIRKRIWIKQGI